MTYCILQPICVRRRWVMTRCTNYVAKEKHWSISYHPARAPADGIYTWKHNQVLEVLAEGLDKARRKCTASGGKGPQFISFFQRPNECAERTWKPTVGGILTTRNEWQMQAEVSRQFIFPQHKATTNWRPDIVLWSQTEDCTVDRTHSTTLHRTDKTHESPPLTYK